MYYKYLDLEEQECLSKWVFKKLIKEGYENDIEKLPIWIDRIKIIIEKYKHKFRNEIYFNHTSYRNIFNLLYKDLKLISCKIVDNSFVYKLLFL